GHGWVDIKTNPNLKARAYSTMDNPNILAQYLVIACSMSMALFLDSKNKLRKLLLFLSTGITFLCLLLTFSRGGWIAFFLAFSMIVLVENKKIIPIGVLFGIVSLFFLPEVVIDRLKTIGNLEDSSNAYRFSIWVAALRMLKDFWFSGVGLGYEAFMKAYPNYMLSGIKAAHAHNLYLQLAIETGIFGLAIFLYNIVKTYTTGIMVLMKSVNSFQKKITIAAMGALSGLLSHGLVEHVLFDYRVIFLFWLMIAIILAAYRQSDEIV
ncbi:MAG: O-antigen ligase family protein, partial [Alkaliphilus sp.]|nr:O-antigen ligase family protein [Alkaliphilus sp.]